MQGIGPSSDKDFSLIPLSPLENVSTSPLSKNISDKQEADDPQLLNYKGIKLEIGSHLLNSTVKVCSKAASALQLTGTSQVQVLKGCMDQLKVNFTAFLNQIKADDHS